MIRASFDQVSKKFGGRTVFEGLTFELRRGGRFGLLGPNGAGKSTLVRLLTGLLRPDAGRVAVGELVPWRDPARVRRHLGILPEGAPLAGELTPREHLVLAGKMRGLGRDEFAREEERLVDALSLAAFYRRPSGVLSQGQKRRTALAAALLGQPDFLILDEPTSGLDPEEAFRLLNLLKSLPADSTLLVSSHLLTEISEITDQALVLAHGRLAAFRPWAELGGGLAAEEDGLRRKYLELIKPEDRQ